jgi:hypothetical protein
MQLLEAQKYCRLESFILWLNIERIVYGICVCCFAFTQIKTGRNRR